MWHVSTVASVNLMLFETICRDCVLIVTFFFLRFNFLSYRFREELLPTTLVPSLFCF